MEMVCLVGIYFCLKKEVKKADNLLFYSLIIITPIVFGSWIYFEVLDNITLLELNVSILRTKSLKHQWFRSKTT